MDVRLHIGRGRAATFRATAQKVFDGEGSCDQSCNEPGGNAGFPVRAPLRAHRAVGHLAGQRPAQPRPLDQTVQHSDSVADVTAALRGACAACNQNANKRRSKPITGE